MPTGDFPTANEILCLVNDYEDIVTFETASQTGTAHG